MHKLLILPVLAYIQAWFELLQHNYWWTIVLGISGFVLWLYILDTAELLKED